MTAQKKYPYCDGIIAVSTLAGFPCSYQNCEGDTIQIRQMVSGEQFGPVTYWSVDGSGECECKIQTPPSGALIAETPDGVITGDELTIVATDMDIGSGQVYSQVTTDCFLVPVASQNRWQNATPLTFVNNELTSDDGDFPDSGGSTVVTEVASSGPSTTSLGACCPCSKGSTEGQGGEGDGPDANGSQETPTNLINLASRGLPLVFTTVHRGGQRFLGPWGNDRSIGIYRKLLEQDGAYGSNISIITQRCSRDVYLKIGENYYPAAGRYGSLVRTDSGWFEKTKEGIYYEYNAHGNLKRVLDLNRNEHYYIYDNNTSAQMLLEIKAEKGLRPYFYYDANAFCERIALRDLNDSSKNKYLYFQYDPAVSYMTKATGPEGCQWYYDYDGNGFITRVTDPDNYSTYFSYAGG